MSKKALKLFLAIMLVLPVFSKTTFIYAEDDEEESVEVEEEKSDYDKCLYDKDLDACTVIAGNVQSSLSEIENKIAEANSNKQKAKELAKEFSEKAQVYQDDIDNLKVQIDELQAKISILESKIQKNESKVAALNTRVKNRMVQAQKTMHFNGYLEFILGSKSFNDMLRRIYGINAIVSKDKADREEYLEIINQLNEDKKSLDEAKAALDESYQEIVSKQAELLKMKEFYEAEEARIQDELDLMTEERDSIYESFSDLKGVLKEMGISVNTGFVPAVHNSWISSTVWNYSSDFLDGKWHLGVDYAASRYTEIHAPAGGVIIRANQGCGDPGYLGSACGEWISGGGNQVYMMCEVNGKIYGFIFFHLNTIYVGYGDFVLQDEVIGTVGSSGSSTGPHCHIEMYYLGDGELADYLDMNWNATFSVGRGRTAYNNRCYYDDGSYRQGAPCILNPEWYLPEN